TAPPENAAPHASNADDKSDSRTAGVRISPRTIAAPLAGQVLRTARYARSVRRSFRIIVGPRKITMVASVVHTMPAVCSGAAAPEPPATAAPITTANISITNVERQPARIRFFQKIAVSIRPVGASVNG